MSKKIIYLLMAMGIFVVGCGQEEMGQETDSIADQIEDELGVSVVLPEAESKEIANAMINYAPDQDEDPLEGDAVGATVGYTDEDESLTPMDEEMVEDWQERQRSRIISESLYENDALISVDIRPGQIDSGDLAEETEIEGHDVHYNLMQTGEIESMVLVVNTGDVGYQIQYMLTDEASESDALDFVEAIIEGHAA
ncbi:hypothetical protein SAMN05421734_101291 [Pelagirhabdus alkalitolerans]|uniref:Uncharacterized protein n=1 Tax=Pelagirhabdus alkalitolerans TaxID=1612202 RepID=A0A1G6GMQ6_9BACI|nr:hypothetical protein [Pelagirhabdus alkalitolerans]SDB83247.1 hypothetical protein SAMN05421734_101291 [Pelagirhabdus alkalitolerans]